MWWAVVARLFYWRWNIAKYYKGKTKFFKRVNDQIRAPKVRLIGPEKQAFGIVPINEALQKSREFGLDLVEIVPNAKPPVCKMIDYSKFLYDQKKKRKQQHKKQKATQLKEIKFRPNTDAHDYNFKMKHIIEFLEKGNKVKVTIRFRGREMAHQDLGIELTTRIAEELKEYGKFDSPPKMEGRFLIGYIAPKN